MFEMHLFDNSEHFDSTLCNQISAIIKHAQQSKGTAALGLCGGETPKGVYEKLAQSELDFERTTFFLSDERCVPHDHPASNFQMLAKTLFAGENKVFLPKLLDFDTGLAPVQAAQEYAKKIDSLPTLNLLLLGVGEDGHFASIFPHSNALLSEHSAVHTRTDAFDIADRLTLSARKILSAEHIFVLLKNKHAVLHELQNGNKSVAEFPAKMLLQKARFFVMMDHM